MACSAILQLSSCLVEQLRPEITEENRIPSDIITLGKPWSLTISLTNSKEEEMEQNVCVLNFGILDNVPRTLAVQDRSPSLGNSRVLNLCYADQNESTHYTTQTLGYLFLTPLITEFPA